VSPRLASAGSSATKVDRVLGREAALISHLTPEQQTALTDLLRLLLDDLHSRLDEDQSTQGGSV
jgi:hypothetical protein